MENLLVGISKVAQTLNRNRNQNSDYNLKPKSFIEYKLEEKYFGYYNQLSTLSFDVSPNLVSLKEIINAFSNLENNWDGCGGFAPSNIVIKNAIHILTHLPFKVFKNFDSEDIFPNPNGTISMEWRNVNNVVGLEIGKDYAVYFSVINSKFEKGAEKIHFPIINLCPNLIQRIESI